MQQGGVRLKTCPLASSRTTSSGRSSHLHLQALEVNDEMPPRGQGRGGPSRNDPAQARPGGPGAGGARAPLPPVEPPPPPAAGARKTERSGVFEGQLLESGRWPRGARAKPRLATSRPRGAGPRPRGAPRPRRGPRGPHRPARPPPPRARSVAPSDRPRTTARWGRGATATGLRSRRCSRRRRARAAARRRGRHPRRAPPPPRRSRRSASPAASGSGSGARAASTSGARCPPSLRQVRTRTAAYRYLPTGLLSLRRRRG